MAGFRIRRQLVSEAILKAKQSEKGRTIIQLDPLEGISVDGVYLVLRAVEKLRDRVEQEEGYRPTGNELKGLVEQVAFATGFPSDRRRAYVLVMMQYYRFLLEYTQHAKGLRTRPRAARPSLRRRAPPLVLVG